MAISDLANELLPQSPSSPSAPPTPSAGTSGISGFADQYFSGTPATTSQSKEIPLNLPVAPIRRTPEGKTIPVAEDRAKALRRPQFGEYMSGGLVMDVFDLLSTGQFAVTGLSESLLEDTGILRETGANIKTGMKERRSNIDLLQRIGRETRQGGVLTGVYEPSTSVARNFVYELPSTFIGLAGDLILDPLLFVGKLGKAGKAAAGTEELGKISGGVMRNVGKAISFARAEIPAAERAFAFMERNLLPRGGQTEAFKELDRLRIIAEKGAQENVNRIISRVIESPATIQQRLTQLRRGGITMNPELQRIVDTIGQEINYAGAVARDVAPQLFNPETFERTFGTYLGGFYRKYVVPTTEEVNKLLKTSSPVRIRTEDVTARENFAAGILEQTRQFFLLNPEERRAVLERVLNPDISPYLVKPSSILEGEEGFNRLVRAIDTAIKTGGATIDDFRFQVSEKSFANVFNQRIYEALGEIKEFGPLAGLSLLKQRGIATRVRFFNELAKTGSVKELPDANFRFQIPNDPKYGDASGKFLSKGDYDAVMGLERYAIDPMTQFTDRMLRLWKSFKIAYNPATIGRNDLTNYFVLNPLGGVPPWRIDLYMKAFEEFHRDGPLWKTFQKVGGGLSDFARTELMENIERVYRTDPGINKFFGTLQKFNQRVLEFYGSQDTFFKFTNFIKGVAEDGMTAREALKRSNFYLVDYSEVPKVVEWLRRSPIGAPFISFTYGVSLPLAQKLLDDPAALSAYYKVLRAMQSLSADTPEADESILPEDLQGLNALKLPFTDQYGRAQYLDLRYILPFNLLESATNNFGTIGSIPGFSQLFGQNPVVQGMAALMTNVNPFTGKEVISSGSSRGEAMMAVVDYVQKMLLPSLAPGAPVVIRGQQRAGGYSFDKLMAAIQGRPDYQGRERDIFTTILDVVVGLKIIPFDPELQSRLDRSEQVKQLEEFRKQLNAAALSKTMTPEEKSAEIIRIREKIQDYVTEHNIGQE